MALSGNLGFVPLEEVLRLLMRSDQRGSVEVRGEDVRGRIFVGKRGIALATTAEDRDLHKHLVNSGYVDDVFLRKVASGESTFSDLGPRESSVVDLLREITIESLYHLGTKGSTFEVTEGAVTPFASPRVFELEAVLDDSRRRADEWAAVHQIISDLDTTIRMNREAGDQEEIHLDREAWRLLCEIGAGASVAAIAERLGTTNFWIAKVAADMAERQLVIFSDGWSEQAAAEPVEASWFSEPVSPVDSWWSGPQIEGQDDSGAVLEDDSAFESRLDAARADDDSVFEQGPEATEEPGSDETKESRFGHFAWSSRSAEGAAAPDEPETAAAEQTDPAETSPQEGEAGEAVEEDTEAFLEKVFSQLDASDKVDVEEEGHGLLRRRRMGSVLKDIDED